MKILVDADACPVISIIERIAKKYKLPVVLLCDTKIHIRLMPEICTCLVMALFC